MSATATAIEIYCPGADTPERTGCLWSGSVPDPDPEAIFRYFNRNSHDDAARLREIGYRLPSLSFGDIISFSGTDRTLILCPLGWAPIDEPTVKSIINSPDPSIAAKLVAMQAVPS